MNNARRITGGILGLNDEILGVIFSRLPVKTLMRLKCLYKDYSMLISSPWFINLYSKRFSSFPDNHCIFVQTGEINRLIHIQNPGNLINLNEPCTTNYTVIGSINGLICLVTTIDSRQWICLWNPAIEQYKMFPVHNDDPEKTRKCYISMGFGYDKDSDDYKVMRILSFKKEELDENFVLASFVWSIEEFFIIAFPEEVITAYQNFVVTNYHGSFAVLAYSSPTKFKARIDVWEIELDIAAKECKWIKKNTFHTDFGLSTHWGLTGGDIVVENAPNMPFLFNLTTKQRWEMRIKPIRSLTNYTQSLVSIKGFRRVRNQLKRKRKASNPVRARLN